MQQPIELEALDFFAERFSEGELRGLLGDQAIAEYFSWVSPSFRKLGVPRSSLSDDQLVGMMLEQPRLIRRPLVVLNGELLKPISGSDRIITALTDLL